MNKQGGLYTVVVTFAVSFVFVGLLAFANELTKDRAAANTLIRERRAVLNAMGIPYSGDSDVLEVYANNVRESRHGELWTGRAEVDGQPVVAVRFSGPGLWGTITFVVAVRPDLSEIVGLDIVSQNETPGLGGRITEGWWKEQFRGEKIVDGRIDVVAGDGRGDEDHTNGRVDAVTGATLTSAAMKNMVNAALAALRSLPEEQTP